MKTVLKFFLLGIALNLEIPAEEFWPRIDFGCQFVITNTTPAILLPQPKPKTILQPW